MPSIKESDAAQVHAIEPCPEPEPCAKHPRVVPTAEPISQPPGELLPLTERDLSMLSGELIVEQLPRFGNGKIIESELMSVFNNFLARLRTRTTPSASKAVKDETALREFINTTETAHFRTPYDTGANLNALFVWNLLRRFAGLPRLTRNDLRDRAGLTDEQMAETERMKRKLNQGGQWKS